MSRIWMVLAGVMLTGAVLSAFGTLDDDARSEAEMVGVSSLIDTVEAMGRGAQEGRITVEVSDVLPTLDSVLTVYNGSIWVGEGPSAKAASIATPLVLVDGGAHVDGMTLRSGDAVIITAAGAPESRAVQLEKVSATNRTVSTNFLHSASVL